MYPLDDVRYALAAMGFSVILGWGLSRRQPGERRQLMVAAGLSMLVGIVVWIIAVVGEVSDAVAKAGVSLALGPGVILVMIWLAERRIPAPDSVSPPPPDPH